MVASGTWSSTSSRSARCPSLAVLPADQHACQTYGLVPQSVYPETFHSSASSVLNTLVKSKLREHATILRELAASLRAGVKPGSVDDEQRMQDLLRAKKEELMQEIYSVLTAALGVPPRPDAPFQWEYYDEKDKYGKWEGTPTEFYRAFSGNCPVSLPSICR